MPITSWTPWRVTRPVAGGFFPAAIRTKELAVALAPHGKGGPTNVRRSVRMRPTGTFSATISAFAPVAAGSKPHEIGPKGTLTKTGRVSRARGAGKFQAVGQKIAGGPYARVHHPGNKGNPFLVKAAATFPRIYAAEVARRMR